MKIPKYYSKYLSWDNINKDDNIESFLDYLEGLNSEDWRELFIDIFLDNPYPILIQKYRKDYSTLTYFAIYISKVPSITKKLIGDVLYGLAMHFVTKNEKNDLLCLRNIIEISRQLEWGLSSNMIIDNIIYNNNLEPELKYDAAIALALYEEKKAFSFWKYYAKKELSNYRYLAFPRFIALQEDDMIEAFDSLQYFEKKEYINSSDLQIPLEDFFYLIAEQKNIWDSIIASYQKFDNWLKYFINSEILANNDFFAFKNALESYSQVFKIGDKIPEIFFTKIKRGKLKTVWVPEINGLRPFDQDYFIDYADQLGLFKIHGYEIKKEVFIDYPSCFDILQKKEIAIVPKPLDYYLNPDVARRVKKIPKKSPIAIINFFKGASIAGPAQNKLPAKQNLLEYFRSLLDFLVTEAQVEALDQAAQLYLEKTISKELSKLLFNKTYPITAHYDYKNNEHSLYKKLQNGGIILTTAPLFAMAKKANYDIYLSPNQIRTLINLFVDKEYKEMMLRELYRSGIHNTLIINRNVTNIEENSEVKKLATICLLTSDYISNNQIEFAKFIESKWKENSDNFDINLTTDIILDSIKESYNFSTFDSYFDNYCNENALQFIEDDTEIFATIYNAVSSDKWKINQLREEINTLLYENIKLFEPQRKMEIETAVKELELYCAVGEIEKCNELSQLIINEINLFRN